ncbi:hypothetical protein E4P82_18935 [Candidatus Competibacter phosphatis]|uniref:Secreted protein n=1 Tax=Candidatus Competibacter phosphatis TaxID=221280 RepID=A0ABX1TNV7_9GAMM|nr:hypothetical protein [Candidatus Competibacter phosphatis]NMQ21086.1 hypothetical protein [Candidatus Competibacter phosphatis]
MSRKGWPRRLLIIACLGVLGVRSAVGIDLHLQDLPPAPGLRPSEALESLSGLREAVNCGLDFLDTAQRCGLSAPSKVVSPFLVRFDPMFCRLTMRFSIGEWIDGLLKQWIAGAFARLSSPAIGALCLLGIGPEYCETQQMNAAVSSLSTRLKNAVVPPGAVSSKAALAPSPAQQQPLESIQEQTRDAGRPVPSVPAPVLTPSSPDPVTPERNPDEPTGLDRLTR